LTIAELSNAGYEIDAVENIRETGDHDLALSNDPIYRQAS